MKKIFSLIVLFLFISCGQPDKKNESAVATEATQNTKAEESAGVQIAITFLNEYIVGGFSADEWIASCDLVTESFKAEYKRMVDEAWKEDPELGLGFDPILDAQDYPDEGFELASYDEKEGYVHLKGKKQEQFTAILKVVEENGKWLVDGSGRINIPEHITEQ